MKRLIRAFIDRRISDEQLLDQMGSPINKVALEALELLKERTFFQDGASHGAQFAGANLENATLAMAQLERVNFSGACSANS